MFLIQKSIICLIFFLLFDYSIQDEIISTINGNKALHKVSEYFLSISIDPAVLLTGLNLSETTLQLAKHLYPAYIRLAGPSTKYIKYIDNDDGAFGHLLEDTTDVTVTPSMWFGINEWLVLANLTPIFAINDVETTKGVWNPKSTLPLLEITDKLNVTCLWQLGYNCSNKTELQYKGDLMIFRHILDAFPERKDSWKIVGSDITKCLDSDHIDNPRRVYEDLENILNAIMWEPEGIDEINYVEKDLSNKLLTTIKSKIPVWTTSSKELHPICFSSAISWTKQIGDAAKIGYKVIFRQPRLHEIFKDTPVYWVSILHKKLMGRTVLDIVKSTGFNSQASIYAHCTKKQNSFVRRGAITILIVNNSTVNHTSLIRFGSINIKNTEVQSYILTSPKDDSTDTYLNENKLSFEIFNKNKTILKPKIRRAKLMQYLSLTLPPKAIGFFVLSVARVPVCINEEEEMQLLMEEIRYDQNIPFSKEISIELASRSNFKKAPTLREIHDLAEKEIKSDEKYYIKKSTTDKTLKRNEFKRAMQNNDIRHYFIERAKFLEKQKKLTTSEHKKSELLQLLKEKSHNADENNNNNTEKKNELENEKQINFELSSVEIRKILTERAKARAAKKNIKFTSAELEELMKKATEKILKNHNPSIKLKIKGKRSIDKQLINQRKHEIKTRLSNLKANVENSPFLKKQLDRLKNLKTIKKKYRKRRDINMDLLKLKTEVLLNNNNNNKQIKSKFKNKEIKEATMRQPNQTSDELLRNDEESEEENEEKKKLPKGEIFAQMASSGKDEYETITEGNGKFYIPKTLFNLPKPLQPKFDLKLPTKAPKYDRPKPNKGKNAEEFTDFIRIATASEGFSIDEGDEEDFPFIHEYFGPQIKVINRNNPKKDEIWEIDEIPIVEKVDNNIPYMSNRGFSTINSNVFKQMDGIDIMSLENDYKDLDSDDHHPVRFKRNVNNLNKTNERNDRNPIQNEYHYILGKPYNPSNNKIDEKKRNRKMALLKKRYHLKKKIADRQQQRKLKKMKNSRQTRSLYEVKDNNLNKKYQSLTEGLKIWKPSDILNLKPTTFLIPRMDNLGPLNDNSFFKNDFNRNNIQRQERDTHNEVKSVENEIDSIINDIAKDTQLVNPEIDTENGDYKVICSHKDKTMVIENQDDTGNKTISEFATQIMTNSTSFAGEYNNNNNESFSLEGKEERFEVKRADTFFQTMFDRISEIFHSLTNRFRSYWGF